MRIVIFGLSISSAWGNGHATLLRGLLRELHAAGNDIYFFERDVPYYAAHRDTAKFDYARLELYSDWDTTAAKASELLRDTDVAVVTSYCPDGAAAGELILQSKAQRKVFYDMDTPVTLAAIEAGQAVPYLPNNDLSGFDLVLSYTGGHALHELRNKLRAKAVAALYGWVDPHVYRRTVPTQSFVADLSYLGTYSPDRQAALETLMLRPAARFTQKRFLIAGAMYPCTDHWPGNVRLLEHVAPPDHPAFYSSSPLTLNVTRGSMARMGYCPSGRLFEAAACGTAVVSDWWTGLDLFFEPGQEILIATDSSDAIAALARSSRGLEEIGKRAQTRTLDCHTAKIRAQRFMRLVESPANDREIESMAALPKGS